MTVETIEISAAMANALVVAAISAAPAAAFGVIAGDGAWAQGGTPRRLVAVRNASSEPSQPELDVMSLREALSSIAAAGEQVWSFFCSAPNSIPLMPQSFPEGQESVPWIVCSATADGPLFRWWQVADGAASVELTVGCTAEEAPRNPSDDPGHHVMSLLGAVRERSRAEQESASAQAQLHAKTSQAKATLETQRQLLNKLLEDRKGRIEGERTAAVARADATLKGELAATAPLEKLPVRLSDALGRCGLAGVLSEQVPAAATSDDNMPSDQLHLLRSTADTELSKAVDAASAAAVRAESLPASRELALLLASGGAAAVCSPFLPLTFTSSTQSWGASLAAAGRSDLVAAELILGFAAVAAGLMWLQRDTSKLPHILAVIASAGLWWPAYQLIPWTGFGPGIGFAPGYWMVFAAPLVATSVVIGQWGSTRSASQRTHEARNQALFHTRNLLAARAAFEGLKERVSREAQPKHDVAVATAAAECEQQLGDARQAFGESIEEAESDCQAALEVAVGEYQRGGWHEGRLEKAAFTASLRVHLDACALSDAAERNPWLFGPWEVDQQIVDWLLAEFMHDEGIDLRTDQQALQRLKEAAEKAKIELSTTTTTEINLPYITADGGGPKHLVITLTRAKLEAVTANPIAKTRALVNSVPKNAGIGPVLSQVRMGDLSLDTARKLAARVPALFLSRAAKHLFIDSRRPDAGSDLLRSVLLRLVLGSAPGSVQLTLVDPVGAGAGFTVFLALPAALRGSRVLVAPEEIEAELRALNRHVESVIQTRLGATYPTIDEYNAANPAVAAPHRLVAILGFPAGGWSERHVELLAPLLRNGPRAGVHVLATIDRSAPVPRGVDLEAVAKAGLGVRIDEAGLGHIDQGELKDWPFKPDTMPQPDKVREWLAAIDVTPRSLSFASIAPALDWSGSSALELAAPIGLDEHGEVHSLRLSDDPGPDVLPAHALVGGMTGMGKSNLLNVLIAGLTARYSPDEVRLYLLDFREGVGFAPYRVLPHARVVALETEREFALSVLRELRSEMVARGKLFKAAGAGDKFKDYRQAGHQLPRILAIIDEFQVLVAEDDPIAREASGILEDLVKRGRGFGVHLLLSSQSPSVAGAYLARLYSQMGLRIALRCRQQDAIAILGEGNDEAARLEAAGEAIYNDQLGRREDNHRVRVAYLPRSEQEVHLAAVVARDAGAHGRPVTFESAAPALLENCERLAAAREGRWRPEPGTAEAFLGEPLEIKDGPTCARFERAPRSNLLIAGPDETEAYGLLAAAVTSLAAQQPEAAFDILEFADRPSSPVFGVLEGISGHFPGRLTLYSSREAAGLLGALADLLAARASADAEEPSRYLVVTGLQRWRELRSTEPIKPTPEAAALLRLLDEGPEHGLHVIAWTDGYAALERTLKRAGIGNFDLRAVLRVPDNDSQNLLDSAIAARLADNRALYRDEQWPLGQLEKFKPYRAGEGEQMMESET